MKKFTFCVSASVLVAALSGSAQAAITSTDEVYDVGVAGVEDQSGYDSDIVPSLITTGQTSLGSVSTSTSPTLFSVGGLNDGMASVATDVLRDDTLTFYDDLRTPVTITFTLAQAYDITSVQSLTGWRDTFFGSQTFELLVETSNSGSYTSLGTFGETPYTGTPPAGFPHVDNEDYAVRTTVFNDSAIPSVLASNVTGVRFVYNDSYPTFDQYNGVVIRELSVFGAATIPEPSALLLTAFGGVALLVRRRK